MSVAVVHSVNICYIIEKEQKISVRDLDVEKNQNYFTKNGFGSSQISKSALFFQRADYSHGLS